MLKPAQNNLLPLSISTSPNCKTPGLIQYSSINKLQLDASHDQTNKSIENRIIKQQKKQNQGGDSKKMDDKTIKKLITNKLGNVEMKYKNIAEKAVERADCLSKANDLLYKNANKPKPKGNTNYSARINKTMAVKPYPMPNYKAKVNQNSTKWKRQLEAKGNHGQNEVKDKVYTNVSIINGLEEQTHCVLDPSPEKLGKFSEQNQMLRKKYRSENKLKKYNYLEPNDLKDPAQIRPYLHENSIKPRVDIGELNRKHEQQFQSLNRHYVQNHSGLRLHSKSGKNLNSYISVLGYQDKQKTVRSREKSMRSIQPIKISETQTSKPDLKYKQPFQIMHTIGSYQGLKSHKYNYLEEISITENKNRQIDRIRSKQKEIKQRERRVQQKQRQLELKNYKQNDSLRQIERQALLNKQKQTREKERIQRQLQSQRQRTQREMQRERKKRELQRQERRKARQSILHQHELGVRSRDIQTVRQQSQSRDARFRDRYWRQVETSHRSSSYNLLAQANPRIHHNPTPSIKQFQIVEQVSEIPQCNCHHQQCECLNMTTQLNTSRLNRLNNKLESYIRNMQKSNHFDKRASPFQY